MPSVSVERTIAAAQQQVWSALADIANARKWNSAWSRVEIISQQTHGTGTVFRAHTEDAQAFDFEVSAWVAPGLIAFSPVRDADEQYGITLESHEFQLQASVNGDTKVRLTARASAHGLRARMIALFFWPGYQRGGLNAALDSLEAVFVPATESSRDARDALSD